VLGNDTLEAPAIRGHEELGTVGWLRAAEPCLILAFSTLACSSANLIQTLTFLNFDDVFLRVLGLARPICFGKTSHHPMSQYAS